jgi:hypothetical protein
MSQENRHFENEVEELKQELEEFQKEKERVRAIIGNIGGVPKFRSKVINAVFLAVIAGSIIMAFIAGQNERIHLLMIELATILLSIKIIYLIHHQMKVNHFEFWILSSLEFRLTEMQKDLRKLRKKVTVIHDQSVSA